MKQRLRITIAVTLLAVTLVFFVHYILGHRYLISKLAHTPPLTVFLIFGLYILWFGALFLIGVATLKLCKNSLAKKENFLLNAYSTLVNFFVPGQGGIAIRGIFLKKIKKLPLRNYILAYLGYYAFYAIVSGVFALSYHRPFWEPVLAALVIGGISALILYLYRQKSKIKSQDMDLSINSFAFLFCATLLQALIQIAIFYTELHAINTKIGLRQSIVYTGVANFSLFVALTPGAIGIRESFLLFTKKLYGISSANIVAANVIDRAVFIVFIGFLFLLTLSFHAKYRSVLSRGSIKSKEDNQPQLSPGD